MTTKLTTSAEDYLEAVLVLSERHDVRVTDLAEYLEFRKPSVSVAVKKLIESGHLVKDRRNAIHLTEDGKTVAESVRKKHRFFTDLLMTAGVEKEKAGVEACRMEHVLSDDSFRKLEVLLS